MAASKLNVPGLLWSRFSWRHWRTAPISSGLLVLILAIGVAAFFSIRLANRAAVSSFQNFTEIITAQSDGLITARVGSLPEKVLRELRQLFGSEPVNIVPVLETTAISPRHSEVESIGSRPTYQLLGLDLPALINLSSGQKNHGAGWFGGEDENHTSKTNETLRTVLKNPLAVFISEKLARRDKLGLNSPLPLIINEHPVILNVAGIIPTDPNHPAAPVNFLVMDLPALQRLADRAGELDRVEFVLPEGPRRSERWNEIAEKLKVAGLNQTPQWLIGSSTDRRASADVMTQAFRLNLTILSLLALLVGLYLVFQGLDGAVVRRRSEIAVLRSLGVTAQQIQTAWLMEAAAMGLVGGLLGMALGWGGAQVAVKLVAQTVNALYYASSADSAMLDGNEALLALLLAVSASVLAGWRPAHAAANTPPAQIATRGGATSFTEGLWLQKPILGLGFAMGGIILSFLPPMRLEGGGRLPLAAYAAALCWIFSAGIFAGKLLSALGRLAHGLAENSVPIRLAASQVRSPSGRHRLAVAGLVCAVGMTAGMAILVGSFERTMTGWIARTFQADLYISSDGAQNASAQSRISPATWQAVKSDPAVKAANIIQFMEIDLGGIKTILVGNDLGFFNDYAHPAWLSQPRDNAIFDPQRNEGLVLVSESFSERFRVKQGDTIQLPVPQGLHSVMIAGVFADYGNERGSILMERRYFTKWYDDSMAASIIMALKPGIDTETFRARLRAQYPGLGVYTSSYLRGEALRIFHQTFAVTYALELIGVVVAVVGLAFTMASLLWERRLDLATMRALGLRRSEISRSAGWEGALTAMAGLGMGLALSAALGWLLIYRINKQTFGWTLQTNWPSAQLTGLSVMVLASAISVAWLVGRWGSRLPAEREE